MDNRLVFAAGAACMLPLMLAAGTVTLPFTFSNGTVADADQVNGNFSALQLALGGILGDDAGTLDASGAASAVRFHYATMGDLPDATSYGGMFAYVADEGAAFLAKDGSWQRLALQQDVYDVFDGVTRNCAGGTQSFDGATATWGDCVGDTWDCNSQPGHPGCLSSSAYASCADIAEDPDFGGSDGAYFIDPDGAGGADPFQVWCDMTTAGGGWTLAGVISSGDGIASGSCAQTWAYDQTRWTDSSTLNTTSFATGADRKFASWSTVSLSSLLIVETVNGDEGYKAYDVGGRASLSALFTGSCATVASTSFASGGVIDDHNAVIFSNQLLRNCNCDYTNNDDDCRLHGGNTNSLGTCYNGGTGFGVDGDSSNCLYQSEARPSRGGWTNQCYSEMNYYTGGLVWNSGGNDLGHFDARIFVR